MKYSLRWLVVTAVLGGGGCSDPVDDYDAGTPDARGEVCFPSCRLGEVCTAANRCVPMTSPFRDAGFTFDRGRD